MRLHCALSHTNMTIIPRVASFIRNHFLFNGAFSHFAVQCSFLDLSAVLSFGLRVSEQLAIIVLNSLEWSISCFVSSRIL